jgi:hypothetical protein
MIDLRAKQSEEQGTMEPVFQECAQSCVNLCALRFPATVYKGDPSCMLIVGDSSIRISDNQIHIQKNFITFVINADNPGEKCGLNVH